MVNLSTNLGYFKILHSNDPILSDLIHFWWMFYSLLTCNVFGQQINHSQWSTALSITDNIPYVRSELDPKKLDRVNKP